MLDFSFWSQRKGNDIAFLLVFAVHSPRVGFPCVQSKFTEILMSSGAATRTRSTWVKNRPVGVTQDGAVACAGDPGERLIARLPSPCVFEDGAEFVFLSSQPS